MTRSADRRARAPSREPRAPAAPSDGRLLDVTVVLLDSGYASEAIGPIEVFHSAGRLWNQLHGAPEQPRFRVRAASLDGRSVTSMYGVRLLPQCSIASVRRTDVIVVPAAGLDVIGWISRNKALLPWLRKWHARGAYVAGVCAGVAFLAECGLLDGRQATTHWAVAEQLRERYPKVTWRPEQFVTEDGRILCSGGVYASIDLSLYLVEKFCGHEIALQCAKALLLGMPRTCQTGYSVVPLSPPHTDERIRSVEHYLHEHFRRDVSIEALAGRAGMGARNFIRRFKAATGRLPGAYVQMLRVGAAKQLLERGAPSIQTVCSNVGYEDVAHFRSLFKRHTGMTPAEYRERFAQHTIDRGEETTARA